MCDPYISRVDRVLTPLESVLFPWLRMAFDVAVEAAVDDIALSTSSPEMIRKVKNCEILQSFYFILFCLFDLIPYVP